YAAARVLATQSRRSDLSGPALQAVHVEAGKYLADRWMDIDPETLLELDTFGHVQGNRFHGEVTSSKVLIVPLMRGGEPLARGVFDRFPHASMVHCFEDDQGKLVDNRLLKSLSTHTINHVVIVDSVINEGHSIRRVLDNVRGAAVDAPEFKISVLTLVMQEAASLLLVKEYPGISFITLRISKNKYKGKGGTDTGNRLFGTTM
ncbi:MAG: hypothetical protein SGILL_004430, partial [Bacillariaceae sp.]